MERVFGCDPSKRDWILAERGFDLLAMSEVFQDRRRLDYPDERFDYGEERHGTNRKSESAAPLRGVIAVPWAMGGPNGYNNGLGISPRGDVFILTESYSDFAIEIVNFSE